MLNRVTKNTVHFCARLLICLQLLLPSALSYAAPGHMDLSSLLCSPSGQSLSLGAEAALKELSEFLGEPVNDTEPSDGYCDKCTVSYAALLPPSQSFRGPLLGQPIPAYTSFEIGLVHKAQGPPTGSRAPPAFI